MQQTQQKLVSIIVITYNSIGEISECLDAVLYPFNNDIELIVIDNVSKDGTIELLKQKYSNDKRINLIFNNENTGFARACNQGAAIASGKYLLLLNPDTIAPLSGIVELIHYSESHAEIGMIGPRITDEYGNIQESYGYDLTPKQEFIGKVLYSKHMEVFPFIKKWKKQNLSTSKISEVGWIGGACMLIKRELYTKINGIDLHFFLSHADMIDLGKRIKDLGYKIVLYPKVSIVHKGSKSIVNNRDSVLRIAYGGTLYFFEKYYSKTTVFLIKFLYVIISLIKSIVAFPLSLFKKDPYGDIATAHFKNAIRIITGTLVKK